MKLGAIAPCVLRARRLPWSVVIVLLCSAAAAQGSPPFSPLPFCVALERVTAHRVKWTDSAPRNRPPKPQGSYPKSKCREASDRRTGASASMDPYLKA